MLKNLIDQKIISLFTLDYSKELSILQLTKELKINYSHAHKRIKELLKKRILKSRKAGQTRLVSINIHNNNAIKLLSFVEETLPVSNPTLDILVQDIIMIDPFACIGLFGSRAKGRSQKESDWDIFVITQEDMEGLKTKYGYTKFDINVFSASEFKQSLLSREETIVKEIVCCKKILFNPHPFYALVQEWESVKNCGKYGGGI